MITTKLYLSLEDQRLLNFRNMMRVSEEYIEEPNKERQGQLWKLALDYARKLHEIETQLGYEPTMKVVNS